MTPVLDVRGLAFAYPDGHQALFGVDLHVHRGERVALLGPNGAGKTTTFNMIRKSPVTFFTAGQLVLTLPPWIGGDVIPDLGDIIINGTSVVRHPKTARASLGVCPQFTAIDSQLTVREHLVIYGKLKGLTSGQELDDNVDAILRGTALHMYADRLASKLSGGNQRKLSLAIALIGKAIMALAIAPSVLTAVVLSLGNPAVVLIDEFSTGIDPKMKRDMWETLRKVSVGKAVIITTRRSSPRYTSSFMLTDPSFRLHGRSICTRKPGRDPRQASPGRRNNRVSCFSLRYVRGTLYLPHSRGDRPRPGGNVEDSWCKEGR